MGARRKSDFELPKRIYRKRGKLYHVTRENVWVPVDGNPEIAASQAQHLRRVRATPDGKGFSDLRKCLTRTQRNAAKRGIQFALSWDDTVAMWHRSRGRCEVSGIPFALVDQRGFKNRPFAISIDRVDNSKGYMAENCRLVCVAVNLAMNEWGVEILLQIAEGIRKSTRRRRGVLDIV